MNKKQNLHTKLNLELHDKLKTIAPKKALTQYNVAARVPRRWYSVDTYFYDRGA
jgi:hypothetical protein